MIIGVFCKLNPKQKFFKTQVDPKVCIKKMKEKDIYISYLMYAFYNSMIDTNYQIKNILSELVTKYPTRIDAYLKYWYILVKDLKDYKLASQLSETFWKNSAILKFDNNIY
jgi:hypothetical protein